jgi:hypothetical protein
MPMKKILSIEDLNIMNRFNRILCLFCYSFLLLNLLFVERAEAVNISSCTNITAAGTYNLVADLVCPGTLNSATGRVVAININSSNVIINLNGHTVTGPDSVSIGGFLTYGFFAESQYGHITIENGTVTGYYDGVELNGGISDSIKNMTIMNVGSSSVQESSCLTSRTSAPMLFVSGPSKGGLITVGFRVTQAGLVTLAIIDIMGREVWRIVDGQKNPGSYFVRWDDSKLSSGTYFYHLRCGTASETLKLVK